MLQLLLPLLAAVDDPVEFAAPELLLADGQPVNAVEAMPYPSPVLFDVDRDGRDELVCGDLWGKLWVHENTAESGEPVWGASKKLETAEGEVLEVSNW
jgi:hypothetical protein